MNTRFKSQFALFEILVIIGMLAALTAIPIGAQQTNAPTAPGTYTATQITDLLTNLPTSSLSAETFGFGVGTVMKGASSFVSYLNFEYIVKTNFAVMAEVQNGTGSQTVDNLGAYFKVRKPWDSAEIYALLGGRKNWSNKAWEGVGGIGIAYTPGLSASGVLSKLTLTAEWRVIESSGTTGGRPNNESLVGIKYPF